MTTIDIVRDGITIDGEAVVVDRAWFENMLGEPDVLPIGDGIERAAWQDGAITVEYRDGEATPRIGIRLDDEVGGAHSPLWWPAERFEGELLLDGVAFYDRIGGMDWSSLSRDGWALKIRGDWTLTLHLSEAFSLSMGEDALYDRLRQAPSPIGVIEFEITSQLEDPFNADELLEEDIERADSEQPVATHAWEIPTLDEPALIFHSFEWKVAILGALMFDHEELKPAFNLSDFARSRGFDPEDFTGYGASPEVREWIMQYPIPARLGALIDTLYLAGDHDIYQEMSRYWDGEGDEFLIPSLAEEELAQFPHLTHIDLGGDFLSDDALAALDAAGIEIEEL